MTRPRTAFCRGAVIAAMAMPATPLRVQAQLPWDSPQLASPAAPAGAGAYFIDFGLRPFDSRGVLLAARTRSGAGGTGFRLAATAPERDRTRVVAAIDVMRPLLEQSTTLPVELAWTAGAGIGWGDHVAAGIPLGLAAGRTFQGERLRLDAYVAPRLVVEARFGDARPRRRFGTALATDIGADLALSRQSSVVLRAAASLGDRRALVIGLHASR